MTNHLRPNLHQINPPMKMITRTKIRPRRNPPSESVSVTAGVAVGVGAMDGLGESRIGMDVRVCVGKGVAVGGGGTRRNSFCPEKITESALSPFHALRSASETSYPLAIPKRASPLWIL